MKRRIPLLILLTMIVSILMIGCGSQAQNDDIAMTSAAYQYATGEIQKQLPYPNSAVFPKLTEGTVEITELENNKMEIVGVVSHREYQTADIQTTPFTMVVEYQGNGLWKTESLEMEQ